MVKDICDRVLSKCPSCCGTKMIGIALKLNPPRTVMRLKGSMWEMLEHGELCFETVLLQCQDCKWSVIISTPLSLPEK